MTRPPNFFANARQEPPKGYDRNGYPIKPATRWTKADNGRTLPLNSAAWRRLRAQVLNEVPLCEYCPAGTITPANTVDHKNNNPADNTRSNLASCCVSCHSRKTASDMHGRPQRMGCDLDGRPLDPNHHWNAAAEKSPGAEGQTPTCSLRAHQSSSQDG